MRDTKIVLSDSEIPSKWYNIMADMANLPGPPLHPATKQPIGPDDLAAIFPMSLIEQEVSTERWIDTTGGGFEDLCPLETKSPVHERRLRDLGDVIDYVE